MGEIFRRVYFLKVLVGLSILFGISSLISNIFDFNFVNVAFVVGGVVCFASIGGQVFPHMAEANISTKALGNYVPKTKFRENITKLNPYLVASGAFLLSTIVIPFT
ncbi:hypothetical protein JOC85_004026 [Bacillus mesophilus]|uniref:Uncharacterized protein n=1 Tax=Bacillus mesophilus TaxID=1808955 RepID=A0A6M0QBX6_9BACI|nr:hypothetical protein [Bacillus mesophilus]MBM7663173.1 hypothetical protein [Bacillus mesophilus]NEY73853.1 hypothetical protein [Bacillus mesophilus]